MADENNELLTQFVSITGADAETSKVYLQSAGWDLQVVYLVLYTFIFLSVIYVFCEKVNITL